MDKRIKVTQNVFNCIKTMLESDAPKAEIAKYLKLNYVTVERVAKAETLEDYRNAVALEKRERDAKKKATRRAVVPSVVPPSTTVDATLPTVAPGKVQMPTQLAVPWEVRKMIAEQNELLKGISAKLAYLVEQLS